MKKIRAAWPAVVGSLVWLLIYSSCADSLDKQDLAADERDQYTGSYEGIYVYSYIDYYTQQFTYDTTLVDVTVEKAESADCIVLSIFDHAYMDYQYTFQLVNGYFRYPEVNMHTIVTLSIAQDTLQYARYTDYCPGGYSCVAVRVSD